MRTMLHQFVQRHISKSRAIPPAPKFRFTKPFFESQPTKSLNDQLSLSEVIGLMHTRQMSRKWANITENLKKKQMFLKKIRQLLLGTIIAKNFFEKSDINWCYNHTSCSLTQQLSSQWVDSRHCKINMIKITIWVIFLLSCQKKNEFYRKFKITLGHQLAGCNSALQSKDSWPVWWHLQQNRILAKLRSLEALRVRLERKLPWEDCGAVRWSALRRPDFSSEKVVSNCVLEH